MKKQDLIKLNNKYCKLLELYMEFMYVTSINSEDQQKLRDRIEKLEEE